MQPPSCSSAPPHSFQKVADGRAAVMFGAKRGRARCLLPVLALLIAQILAPATAMGGGTRSISLTWDPVPDPDVIGYHLYYGNSSGNYTTMIDVPNTTTATVLNLPTHQTYFSVVTAYDSTGIESFPSNEVSFVVPNLPPVVNITNPVNGTAFNGPRSLSISANATDPDGTVAKVEFYEGTTLLGSVWAAPFSITWDAVPVGSHQVFAVAYDNDGAATQSAPVTFKMAGLNARIFQLYGQGNGKGQVSAPLPSGNYAITGACAAGSTISIYASGDLVHWTLIGTVAGTYGSYFFIDYGAANYTRRFYQVSGN